MSFCGLESAIIDATNIAARKNSKLLGINANFLVHFGGNGSKRLPDMVRHSTSQGDWRQSSDPPNRKKKPLPENKSKVRSANLYPFCGVRCMRSESAPKWLVKLFQILTNSMANSSILATSCDYAGLPSFRVENVDEVASFHAYRRACISGESVPSGDGAKL